jgi:hypothetical protein
MIAENTAALEGLEGRLAASQAQALEALTTQLEEIAARLDALSSRNPRKWWQRG